MSEQYEIMMLEREVDALKKELSEMKSQWLKDQYAEYCRVVNKNLGNPSPYDLWFHVCHKGMSQQEYHIMQHKEKIKNLSEYEKRKAFEDWCSCWCQRSKRPSYAFWLANGSSYDKNGIEEQGE